MSFESQNAMHTYGSHRNTFWKCKPFVTGVCWEFVVVVVVDGGDDDDGKASSSENRAFMITCYRRLSCCFLCFADRASCCDSGLMTNLMHNYVI